MRFFDSETAVTVAAFMGCLKHEGVQFSDERVVIERLAEARDWRYAFRTLVKQGQRIGILISGSTQASLSGRLQTILQEFRFSPQACAELQACLSQNS